MHKLFSRQLRTAAKKDGGGLDVDALCAIVDQTYDEFDRERRLNDRAATLMEDELKAANAQAKREHDAVLAAILDNATDGMLVVREDGRIDIANGAAEKQFAAKQGGLVGQPIDNLLAPPADVLAPGADIPKSHVEATGTALDGRIFPVEFSCATLQISGGRRRLWIVRDISERVRAQREIMETQMRFQDFAEASSDCFWEMDQSLHACEISAADDPEFAQRMRHLLLPGSDGRAPHNIADDGWRALRHYLSSRQRFRLRLDIRTDDGDTIFVSVSGKPVFDLDERFRGYRGTARDVTREVSAREAARRAERRLIEAMDAAPAAVALLDADLQLVGGNSALRALASSNGERLAFGRPFDAFLAAESEDGAAPALLLRRLAAGREMRELMIGETWYLLAARGLSEGGMVLTFSDVHDLKQRERELAEAKIAAESASRLKSQFLATMSHELRTPLNAILGFSEVIRDSVFGKEIGAIKKYSDYAGSIHTSGRHLLSLISEILDLSKIEAGSYVLDVTTLDMREVMHGALTIISAAAGNAGIDLRYALPDEAMYVSGDDRSIRQVALNLLANAVKFTPRGGAVALELSMRGGYVEFAISDTGIGIAKEHIEAVFEPFRQVDASIRRRHEGTGLGLAITKRLVELHGGKIALESEPGIGTTVRVKLPPTLHVPASQSSEVAA